MSIKPDRYIEFKIRNKESVIIHVGSQLNPNQIKALRNADIQQVEILTQEEARLWHIKRKIKKEFEVLRNSYDDEKFAVLSTIENLVEKI